MLNWDYLTHIKSKRKIYETDPSFRVAVDEVSVFWPLLNFQALYDYSAIIFKPDAVVRRVVKEALDYLGDLGFYPVAVRTIKLDEQTSHALWRYQWNRASTDRLRLAELFGVQTPSLMVILKSDRHDLPATVRLSALKGPADANRRKPEHLRSRLGMRNRMLSLIHCPDEPADLLRDLAITLGSERRPGLWGELVSASDRCQRVQVLEQASVLFDAYRAHDLDPDGVVARRGLSGLASRGTTLPLDTISSAFGPIVTPQDAWDFITIAAELIEHHVPGQMPLIESMNFDTLARAWDGSAKACTEQG